MLSERRASTPGPSRFPPHSSQDVASRSRAPAVPATAGGTSFTASRSDAPAGCRSKRTFRRPLRMDLVDPGFPTAWPAARGIPGGPLTAKVLLDAVSEAREVASLVAREPRHERFWPSRPSEASTAAFAGTENLNSTRAATVAAGALPCHCPRGRNIRVVRPTRTARSAVPFDRFSLRAPAGFEPWRTTLGSNSQRFTGAQAHSGWASIDPKRTRTSPGTEAPPRASP